MLYVFHFCLIAANAWEGAHPSTTKSMALDPSTMALTWAALEASRAATGVVFDDSVAAVVASVALATAMACEETIIGWLAEMVAASERRIIAEGGYVEGFKFDRRVIDQANRIVVLVSTIFGSVAASALMDCPVERVSLPIRKRIGRLAFKRRI